MVTVQVLLLAISLSVAQLPGLEPETQPDWASLTHWREEGETEPQSPLQAAM